MLEECWTYSNPLGLTKWYGHVDYYDQYVIGQWFALDADTGSELWSRRFRRPNTVCGYAHNMIIASEMRSDGPWTCGFGIYGINAQTGELQWTNHGHGLWGRVLRGLDYIPGFTNELRDVAKCVTGQYVVTKRVRILDIQTGRECSSVELDPLDTSQSSSEKSLYKNKSLEIDGSTIYVDGHQDNFVVFRRERSGREEWRFAASDLASYVEGNYYSYRLHGSRIFIIISDAPNRVPIKKDKPLFVKPNPVNYQLGVLDVITGEFTLHPLTNGKKRVECRMETIYRDRILVSYDGTQLVEYKTVM